MAKRISLFLLNVVVVWSGVAALFFFATIQWVDRFSFIVPSQVSELFGSLWIFGVITVVAGAARWALGRRATCSMRWAQLGLLAGVLLVLISVDRALLVGFPPPSELNSLLEPHPQRGWVLRRDAVGTDADVTARTNSLGLRGIEVPREKPPGEQRILFIGDSVTFGYGLSEDDTLPARVGDRLRRKVTGATVRCINAGVSGYTTWQELDYLRSDGLALAPDLIVLQFSLNDILDVLMVDPGRVHGRQIDFEFSNSSNWSGMIRAILSLRARRYWQDAKDTLVWIDERDRQQAAQLGSFQTMFAEPPPPFVEKAWQRVLSDLTAFDGVCRSHGIPWVLIVTPPRSQFDPALPPLRPQSRLRAWADAHRVPLFDPLPRIAQFGKAHQRSADELYLDEGHPAPETMVLIAEALADFLVEQQWVVREDATDTAPRR